MPTLYYNEVYENRHQTDKVIKILFVGRVSQAYKNIYFLIDGYLQLKESGHKIHLTIVWENHEKDFLEKYKFELKNNIFSYVGPKNKDELHNIYSDHDIFVLPSNSDPIWAVVLEAMSHGLAVVVSDSVWASCYVENWINWFIFETNNSDDFTHKIELLTESDILSVCKQNSSRIMKEKYRVKNDIVTENLYQGLSTFIQSN